MNSSNDARKFQLCTQRNGTTNTRLHIAIKENRTAAFNLFLKECNVNAKNRWDESPLHYAVLYNRLEIVKTLINNGAIVEVKDFKGQTPLSIALAKQNVQIAEILFKNGAVLNERDLTYMRPLRFAAWKGNLEMVKLLMLNGCNKVDIPKTSGSALKYAALYGHLEVLKYLMNNGSKSSATLDKDDLRLLQTATERGRLTILKCLVDAGVKTETDNIFLNTVGNRYTINDCYDMWNYLLTHMSKIHAKTFFCENQLHSAVRMGNVEAVRAIVNDFKTDPFASKLAVYIAVENNNEEILQVLLNAGYSIEGCFESTSPLHVAATFEQTTLVKMLLKAGADVNSQTKNGLTPLHFAAIARHSTMVKFLLKSGADPSKTCESNRTPLLMALKMFPNYNCTISSLIFENLVEITKMLILSSKNNNECNQLLIIAIHIRVLSNNTEGNNFSSNDSKVQILDNVGTVDKSSKNSEFRPELVRCILNYQTDKEIIEDSEVIMITNSPSGYTPELWHLIMEYNDFKSCCDLEIHCRETDYKCLILEIGYSRNVDDLLYTNAESISSFFDDYYYKTVKEDVLKLIVARLVLLMKSSHPRVLNYCLRNKCDDWRKKCEAEIVSMQNTKIDDYLNISFYDILTKSVDKLAMYTRKEIFQKAMESSYVKFPAYADFLKTNVEMGKRRKDLINECVNLMHKLVMKNHKIQISDHDIDLIFQFLSIIDLRRFSAACS